MASMIGTRDHGCCSIDDEEKLIKFVFKYAKDIREIKSWSQLYSLYPFIGQLFTFKSHNLLLLMGHVQTNLGSFWYTCHWGEIGLEYIERTNLTKNATRRTIGC